MTFNRFLSISTLLVPIILLFSMIAGAYFYKHLEKKFRFVLLYFAVCFTIDILSRVAGEIYKNNLIFIVIFSLLELAFFYVFYRNCFFREKKPMYLIATCLALAYIVCEIFLLKDVTPKDFQPYSKVICSFLIIIMSINCLFDNITREPQDSSNIMLNSAFVIYFSLNLIFFLPVNFLINVTSSVKFYFWCANLLLTVSFYIFLSWQIWTNGSTHKRLRSG
jgi:hypothetical protein